MYLGNLIKRKRIELNISSRELSKKLEISNMYLNLIENNKRVPMSSKKKILENLSKILQINFEELKNLAKKTKKEMKNHPEKFLKDWCKIPNVYYIFQDKPGHYIARNSVSEIDGEGEDPIEAIKRQLSKEKSIFSKVSI